MREITKEEIEQENFAVAMDWNGKIVKIPVELYKYYEKNLLPFGWSIIAKPYGY